MPPEKAISLPPPKKALSFLPPKEGLFPSAAEEGLFPSAAEEGGSLREYGERLPFPIYKYRNIEEVWPGCRALLPNKNKKGAPTRPKGRMI